MSGKQLREEYQRLVGEIADAAASAGPGAWPLLERLRSLTERCMEGIVENEAQIAELKRKIFGPRADRLSPEQEGQLQNVIDDIEAEAERPAPDSGEVLLEEPYESLSRQQSGIQRIGCLAHSRRYFYKALQENFSDAAWFIAQIRLLYRIEDGIRGLPADQRNASRKLSAPEIWDRLKSKAQQLQPALLPKSTMGKAVNYFLNEYDALTGYLQDGRFEIDNNLIENSIRPTAVGRKRWLFIGHPDAGWRSAVIYSILVSCRRRGINSQDYLTDVLARLPAIKINQIDSLLPAHWKPATADPD